MISLYKSICCWSSFELPQFVEAIQKITNKICFYKEADKNTWSYFEDYELLGCALIGVCEVIRLNTVLVLNDPLMTLQNSGNPDQMLLNIGLDKGGYPVNIFLISPRKHMLWVLIRIASVRRF